MLEPHVRVERRGKDAPVFWKGVEARKAWSLEVPARMGTVSQQNDGPLGVRVAAPMGLGGTFRAGADG